MPPIQTVAARMWSQIEKRCGARAIEEERKSFRRRTR
jgi:hypothetical protein